MIFASTTELVSVKFACVNFSAGLNGIDNTKEGNDRIILVLVSITIVICIILTISTLVTKLLTCSKKTRAVAERDEMISREVSHSLLTSDV